MKRNIQGNYPSTSRGLDQAGASLRNFGIFPAMQTQKKTMIKKLRSNSNNYRQPTFINESAEDQEDNAQVKKKFGRKRITAYSRLKKWNMEDAQKALELENECNKISKSSMLILKFPDPDLNEYIVKQYSYGIDTVQFEQPSTPRYCFVTLKVGTDLEKVRSELCKIPFGSGKIIAEKQNSSNKEIRPATPEEIDPYTLYVGNLPKNVGIKEVKKYFFDAARIYMSKSEHVKSRYAFLRYCDGQSAIKAHKRTFNTLIGNRSLIVRFRRLKIIKSIIGIQANKDENSIKGGDVQSSGQVIINENPIIISDESEVDSEVEDNSTSEISDEPITKKHENFQNSRNKNDTNVVVKEEFSQFKYYTSGNIIPSRTIKEESIDDDELFDHVTIYNMGSDMDEEDSEEDDFLNNMRPVQSEPLTLEPFSLRAKVKDKSNFKASQSIEEIDMKPDISLLQSIPNKTPSSNDFSQSRYEYSKSRTKYLRSKIQQSLNQKNDTVFKNKKKDDKDEDDIFFNLNAENDFDSMDDFDFLL